VSACEQACLSLAGALGPFGEYIVIIVAGLVAWFSRRQVLKARTETVAAKSEGEAFKQVAMSIRPISELAQLSIPPLPIVRSGFVPTSSTRSSEARPSMARDSDRPPDDEGPL
jgi:hypothetical protein